MPFISSARKQFGPQGRKNTPWRAFPFSTHTFTTSGVSGQTGPTIAQSRSAYSSTSWANTFLNSGTAQGFQRLTVPSSGLYRVVVAGSQGQNTPSRTGGNGAVITAIVYLVANETIDIVCGQRITSNTASTNISAGGGGASFIKRNSNNSPLVVAGGGGGAGGNWNGSNNQTNGSAGATSVDGNPTVPNTSWTSVDDSISGIGNGGRSGSSQAPTYDGVAGGGGWNSKGEDGGNSSTGGQRLLDNAVGGTANNDGSNFGGFGGGGGSRNVAGAGGGGYTGGNGASWTNAPDPGGGGGGGSFIASGVSLVSASATNAGQGYVTITKL